MKLTALDILVKATHNLTLKINNTIIIGSHGQ